MKKGIVKKKKGAKRETSFSSNRSASEMIQERAYLIWERKGRLEGTSMEDWVEAEKELEREGML
ncbi:MAG: DUF2934 domain-containing protein [Candidatus Omnitrophica bacterium]|nr:DUF2934 domain-containing protein [Candidatus Omnitrophota bacterium]